MSVLKQLKVIASDINSEHYTHYKFHRMAANIARDIIKQDTGHNRLYKEKGQPHPEVAKHTLYHLYKAHQKHAELHFNKHLKTEE